VPSPTPDTPAHGLLSPGERQWRAVLTLGWPLALGAAPVLLRANLPLCAFRHVTGLPCPLCGGTHAGAALAQGDLMAAWQAHPGLMPLAALAAVATLQWAWEAWRGRRVTCLRIGPGAWQAGGLWWMGAWGLRLLGWV
jgi:hypothetical protein